MKIYLVLNKDPYSGASVIEGAYMDKVKAEKEARGYTCTVAITGHYLGKEDMVVRTGEVQEIDLIE